MRSRLGRAAEHEALGLELLAVDAGPVHAAHGSGTAGVVPEAGDDLAEPAAAPAECDAAAAGLVPVDPLPAGVR